MQAVVQDFSSSGVLRIERMPIKLMSVDPRGKEPSMADKGLATDAEIQSALAELPGWKRQANALQKTFELKGFKAAMAVAGTVGGLAHPAGHRPDILSSFHKAT